jgi:triacylglycerol lipase
MIYCYPINQRNLFTFAYDLNSAIFLVALCYQSHILYKDPSNFKLPVFPEMFKLVSSFQGAGGYPGGYIIESPTTAIIVFRGSATSEDFVKDIQFIRVPYKLVPNAGWVHAGFYDIYTKNRENQSGPRDVIFKSLATINPSKTLYITGHSLGGALATLCTLDVAVNTPFKQPIIYTFGSPRVGESQFVSTFDKQINTSVRIVNYYDYIPSLPPDAGYMDVKGKFEIKVNTGGLDTNHFITTAYFPGLSKLAPDYAATLCNKNLPGFCPTNIKTFYLLYV